MSLHCEVQGSPNQPGANRLRLAETTLAKIRLKVEEINVFSDSIIALCWLQENRRLPPFVSSLVQRIGLIRGRLSEKARISFFHVPIGENFADCVIRGLPKEELVNHTWWSGPIWLNRNKVNWPITNAADLRPQEVEETEEASLNNLYVSSTVALKSVWPVDKLSSLSKLKRVVAYCIRFIRIASKQSHYRLEDPGVQTSTFTAAEVEQAENIIIRQEQIIYGSQTLMLNEQHNVSYHDDGLLRKFSRLQNSDISDDAANLIHIPKLSLATDLSAKSFIFTLKRFIARCGVPQKVISDNGTNFQLAELLLRNDRSDEEDSSLSLYLADYKISRASFPLSHHGWEEYGKEWLES
ncbi:hypothetical protein OESDEN_00265 [Oesophagostomum dentatum]|uniref:Pao retrotransposon peptidase n=1 Tax=Oesophagostomum dentatum TaxID=61180 RepID=A0A0B1TUF6_OESDE|nr:hypothetical protein OESDEN_00265 [Oesophagostomum dentatum]